MRYTEEDKERTRRRILESAGRLFKADGIGGTGIAGLMSDVGLTNGAFYKHFSSKDDLVANAVISQLAVQLSRVNALPPGRAGLQEFIRYYLSPEHRDNAALGCPSAALLNEISRHSTEVRQAFTDSFAAFIDALASRVNPDNPTASTTAVTTAFALMAGTMQISRALTDTTLADELLRRAATDALTLLDTAANQN
ncbi:TetR/AcrR family transcriptional regulator [Streptomyces phaeofaciens JCM 4814]|uniref:TetR family transcriptional regulator n=1 Tax=Streptomyces phaeofaciens TaxID=68254 RepID=A0A918HQX3_9ACTN|nr:TetR/AcrR family transcriptional regulator [Streptomyces phaeofaciens]GGT97620.1 TetR family transcriptional regulator [Streptomyces phaeofaciens]